LWYRIWHSADSTVRPGEELHFDLRRRRPTRPAVPEAVATEHVRIATRVDNALDVVWDLASGDTQRPVHGIEEHHRLDLHVHVFESLRDTDYA
jgi:hypothetical protein